MNCVRCTIHLQQYNVDRNKKGAKECETRIHVNIRCILGIDED